MFLNFEARDVNKGNSSIDTSEKLNLNISYPSFYQFRHIIHYCCYFWHDLTKGISIQFASINSFTLRNYKGVAF